MRIAACFIVLAITVTAFHSANADDKMVYAAKATSKFVNFPGLPKCATGSVQNGDPSKGGSVILLKSAAGCNIPWHWHTANEQLMVVTGSAKVAMKDGSPATIHSGDYLSLPAKNPHQFSCTAACNLFIVSDAAFDIHYVDKDGKEISPDEALKAKPGAPMKKESKDKMKM
jgi:quercetin dioxygenase-like cupin family protein